MKAYSIFIALFILGAMLTGINDSGLYNVALPETQATISQAEIRDVNEGIAEQGVNPLSVMFSLFFFIKVLIGGFISLFAIGVVIMQFGFPLWMAAIPQAGAWIVELWGLYQIVTGHQTQGAD